MKNITNFTQENALTLINSADDFPVDFELAWKWLDFSRRDSAKRTLIACGFEEGSDFLILHNDVEQIEVEAKKFTRGRRKGQGMERIWLTTECFKSWGMMASTERGKEVRSPESEVRPMPYFCILTTAWRPSSRHKGTMPPVTVSLCACFRMPRSSRAGWGPSGGVNEHGHGDSLVGKYGWSLRHRGDKNLHRISRR